MDERVDVRLAKAAPDNWLPKGQTPKDKRPKEGGIAAGSNSIPESLSKCSGRYPSPESAELVKYGAFVTDPRVHSPG